MSYERDECYGYYECYGKTFGYFLPLTFYLLPCALFSAHSLNRVASRHSPTLHDHREQHYRRDKA